VVLFYVFTLYFTLAFLCVGLPELEKVIVMPFCMAEEDIDISSIPNRFDLRVHAQIKCSCTHIHTHTCHMRAYIQHTHTHTHTYYTHTYIHMHIHTCTYTHTYTHTCTHAHTYTQLHYTYVFD